jgi:ubiquinone/menaquinone biosynthesis C-methylase UbiE
MPVTEPGRSLAAENDALRHYYDANASTYDEWMRSYDRVMLGDARRRVCGLATGRTLELGVGTGLNLPHYPGGVDLVAVDYSPQMLDVARARAGAIGRAVDLRLEDAHALTLDDASFDTVVTTLFLSSAPDPGQVVTEIRRVLRGGGRVLVLDHVRSRRRPVAWVQRVTEPFVSSRTGVHLDRDPLDHLVTLGFDIEREQRARLGVVQAVVARKP